MGIYKGKPKGSHCRHAPIQIGCEYFIVRGMKQSVSKVNEYLLAEQESVSRGNTAD